LRNLEKSPVLLRRRKKCRGTFKKSGQTKKKKEMDFSQEEKEKVMMGI